MPLHAAPLDIARLLRDTPLAHAEHHALLGSTNDRARELAADREDPLPALVSADSQTAGRGRGANRWWTGGGSLAFSLAFDPARLGLPRRDTPQLSLAAAVALLDCLGDVLAGRAAGLHWPNDVFVDGRKLAGVLVEALPDGRCVLGMGVNTNNTLADAPEELRAIAATLWDLTGQETDHTSLLVRLINSLWEFLEALARDRGALGARYDALCLQRGAWLTIAAGQQRTSGHCAGIGADGALLLDSATGRQRLYGGTLVKDEYNGAR